MVRLTTALDLLQKAKRVAEVQSDFKVIHQIFDIGFFLGMASHSDFMEDISSLPKEDGTKQLQAMEEEVTKIIRGFGKNS